MENPIKWASLLKIIYDGKTAKCPHCGNENVTHRFVADDYVGFAQFKCNSCGKEAHLSRVTFPVNVKTEKMI